MTSAAGPSRLRPPARRRHRGRSWWVVAAVLLLVAAGCCTALLRDRSDPVVVAAGPDPTPAGRTVPPPDAGAPTPAGSLVPAVPRVPPVALRIPALGLAVSLSELGLNRDRTVQVPTDFQQPGWYRLGPTPGQPGSAVILGHVDSYRGPAVFFRLRSLRAGDLVEVGLADGEVARFAVRAVASYPKRAFPARQVYGPHGGRALQLVTCGGEFDRAARSYLSNIVVYTELVSVTPAPGSRLHGALGSRNGRS